MMAEIINSGCCYEGYVLREAFPKCMFGGAEFKTGSSKSASNENHVFGHVSMPKECFYVL